jgi:hypothetical protein
MPTVQYDLIFSVYFIYNPGNNLRQTLPDVLAVEEVAVDIQY